MPDSISWATMFDTGSPDDKASLIRALGALERESSRYLEPWTTDRFFAPQGDKWSPAEHVRHLSKSVRPVAMALRIPKLVLALRFGIARGESASFEAIRARYHRQLESGADAGRYGPSDRASELEPEAWKRQILARWTRVNDDLIAALEGWRERALDRYRLPHPLLGKLTVREMLFFTVYHNAHHPRRIAERAGELGDEADG